MYKELTKVFQKYDNNFIKAAFPYKAAQKNGPSTHAVLGPVGILGDMPQSIVGLAVAHDAVLGGLDEADDFVDFDACGDLLANLNHGVFEAEVARVDEAVGVGDVAQDALRQTFVLQDDGVHAVIGCGVAAEDSVGRHVVLHAAAALHERELAHAHMLLYHGAAALDGAVEDFAVACYAHADAEHAAVVNVRVVADVHLVHEEVAVANNGGRVGVGAAGDDHVFADAVVVADDDCRARAGHVVEVLRLCADYGVLVHLVAAAHRGVLHDGGVGHDDAVVADGDVLVDVGKGLNLNVVAEFSRGVYVC